MTHPENLPGNLEQPTVTAATIDKSDDSVEAEEEEFHNFGPPAEPGEIGTLGPYRIIKKLGQGGMGAVYLALNTRLNRKLALKIMLPRYAANAAAKERFLREAQTSAQLSHDHIVTVYDADERGGMPFIAMQFLQGYPLDLYLRKKGNPSIPQILHIAKDTAIGLAAAHRVGLVHRDIKPANLWLEAPKGRVKIVDFGLAKPVDADTELTKTGAVVGTPAYMSPEQARGLKVDHRTDLFSLGAVLYRLCTGRIPFDGPNTMAVLMALASEEPAPVAQLNPQVTEPLATLIHQLLAKNPNQRPQSADEVAQRIQLMIEGWSNPAGLHAGMSTSSAAQYTPLEIVADAESNPFEALHETAGNSATESQMSSKVMRPKPAGKSPWLAAMAAVLLVGIVLSAIFIMKRKDGGSTRTDASEGSTAGGDNKDKTFAKPVDDREAAKFAISLGGTVKNLSDDRWLAKEAEVPKERFKLSAVGLNGNQKVTDAGLAMFKDCKNFREIHLGKTAVTDAGLANFKDAKYITVLILNGLPLTDAGLANFKGSTDLVQLNLDGCSQITDQGVANFQACKYLKELNLNDTRVTDEGLAAFQECDVLVSLHLRQTLITDASLARLKVHHNLANLNIEGTAVTDEGIAALKDYKKLVNIDLRKTKVTPGGIEDLHKVLWQSKILHDGGIIEPTDWDRVAAASVLAAGGFVSINNETREFRVATDLPKVHFNLTRINLDKTEATDALLANLKELKNLAELRLNRTGITNAGLAHLKDAKTLKIVSLDDTQVTDAGLAHLKECKSLTLLSLAGTQVTNKGLAQFKSCKTFHHINLFNTQVSDAGLENFKGCKSLTYLALGKTAVTGAGLAVFKESKLLTNLYLEETRVGDAALEAFKGCQKLVHLNVAKTQMTDVGLAHFKDCKNLTDLWLNGTSVSDEGIGQFKNCTSLKLLDLRNTQVSMPQIEKLKAALPQCTIVYDP